MARRAKGEVNKAESIRAYKLKNPNATNKEVVEALAAQGIEITSQHVSNTMSRVPGGVKKRRRRRKKKMAAAAAPRKTRKSASPDYAPLLEAKAFVDKAGSVEAARRALDVLAKLQ